MIQFYSDANPNPLAVVDMNLYVAEIVMKELNIEPAFIGEIHKDDLQARLDALVDRKIAENAPDDPDIQRYIKLLQWLCWAATTEKPMIVWS